MALKGKMQKYFQHENTRQWNWKLPDKTYNPFSSTGVGAGSGPSEIDVSAVITLFFLIHLKCLSSSQTGTLNYEAKTQILI